jgi:G:T-mismatch repair DNA endonuclease (very short patch repair protein)
MGWKVVNVWECAVKAGDCSDVIDRAIRSVERLVDVR